MRTCKSPLRILKLALLIGELTLAKYAHRFSPKKFTQPQLFACLVLKEFQHWDYRKLQANLVDSPEWVRTLDLKAVPHFTNFQKASKRLLRSAQARRLLGKTIRYARVVKGLPKRIDLAALDGTGFESHHASSYYVRVAQTVSGWHKRCQRRS